MDLHPAVSLGNFLRVSAGWLVDIRCLGPDEHYGQHQSREPDEVERCNGFGGLDQHRPMNPELLPAAMVVKGTTCSAVFPAAEFRSQSDGIEPWFARIARIRKCGWQMTETTQPFLAYICDG